MKIICFLLLASISFGQQVKEYNPIEIRKIKTDFSPEFVEKYNSEESLKRCNEIWSRMYKNHLEFVDLSKDDQKSLEYCDEQDGNPWSKLFQGCSWYCGGRVDTIYSSSKMNTKFIDDSDYGTAWISEIKNNLDLPFIKYIFKPESATVTDIVFVNGNAKSKELFEKYSRAKTIKMYVNEVFFCVLNLQDNRNEQVFRLKPIGTLDRKNYEAMEKLPKWSLRFEIIEIYKGKNNSVAISELYFDGDGHEDNDE